MKNLSRVNLKHLSEFCGEHLTSESKSKICFLKDRVPQSKGRTMGWGMKERAWCRHAPVKRRRPLKSPLTCLHMPPATVMRPKEVGTVYHYFHSGGV